MKNVHAYIAGLVDGEGSVSLLRTHKSAKFKVPVVSISSTSKELLMFVKQHYPKGVLVSHKTYQAHHKPSWSITYHYNNAIELLQDILPFMIEGNKVYRATHILTNYKSVTHRNGKYTEEQFAAKLQFEHEFFHPSDTMEEISSVGAL